jgi:hypothetical protein
MDHCLLQVPRALLRLRTPQKNAHFAGRAGAVMDGGGLTGCLDAGQWRVEFATTNPCRNRESCALSPFLNSRLFAPRSQSDESPSLCRPCPARAVEIPSLAQTIDRPISASGRRVEGNATDFDCGSESNCCSFDFNFGSTESSSEHSIRGENFLVCLAERHQVSMRDDDRQLAKTIAPPTNPHLGALGPSLCGAGRGFLVCRREYWRHGSRACQSLRHRASPNFGDRERRTRRAGMISRAQPSHLCGGGSPTCRPLFSVLLLLLPFVWRRSLVGPEADRVSRPRRSRLSPRRKTAAIPDKRGTPLEVACVPRRKPSRIKRRSVPGMDSGGTEHRFSSV